MMEFIFSVYNFAVFSLSLSLACCCSDGVIIDTLCVFVLSVCVRIDDDGRFQSGRTL